MARRRTELGAGAKHVAWHDALVHVTGLTNDALDLKYAVYRADGSRRDDGGALGTFRNIARHGYDPATVHADKKSKSKKNMSVFEAVSRDPDLAFLTADICDQGLWQLLSREVGGVELKAIIATALRRQGLFRPLEADRGIGRRFIRDHAVFDYAGNDTMADAYMAITRQGTVGSLTLLAALGRESYRLGIFEYSETLRTEFEFCLMNVTARYGFSKRLDRLIYWLAVLRVFSNRWDEDIPNAWSRQQAMWKINSDRSEKGLQPLTKHEFWVEALALQYHNTAPLYKYAPVPLTPDLEWLEQHRERLHQVLTDWEKTGEADDCFCPLF
jgi:hypothetical protein